MMSCKLMKRSLSVSVISAIAFIALISMPHKANALPQWAIKYNVKCTACHALAYAKLNATGYAFRRLGFRLPGEVSDGNPGPEGPGTPGKEAPKYDLINYFSAREQAKYVAESPSYKGAAGSVDSSGSFQQSGTSLYAAGPLPADMSLWIEDEVAATGSATSGSGLGNAYFQWNHGTYDKLISIKGGQFNTIELVGPFDSGVLSSPVSSSINGYSAPGTTERGVQFGYTYKQNTTATFGIYNGISTLGGISGATDPTANGTQDSNTAKDWMLQGVHLFDKYGTSISGFYYNGNIVVPTAGAVPQYTDSFDSYGIGGSYFLKPNLNIQGDYVHGSHSSNLPTPSGFVNPAGSVPGITNYGYSAEVDYGFNQKTVGVARYSAVEQNGVTGATAASAGPTSAYGTTKQVAVGALYSLSPFTRFYLLWQHNMDASNSATKTNVLTGDVDILF